MLSLAAADGRQRWGQVIGIEGTRPKNGKVNGFYPLFLKEKSSYANKQISSQQLLTKTGCAGAPGWDKERSSFPDLEGRRGWLFQAVDHDEKVHAVNRGSRIQRTEIAPQLQAETERIRDPFISGFWLE